MPAMCVAGIKPALPLASGCHSYRQRSIALAEELIHSQVNVLDDLAQKNRREIAALMKWNGCASAVGMPELTMGSALPNLHEPKIGQDIDDLTGFEDWNVSHDYATTTL